MTDQKKQTIKNIIIYILSAILGLLTSCTTTYIIQKGNGTIKVEQSTTNTQKADSTNVELLNPKL